MVGSLRPQDKDAKKAKKMMSKRALKSMMEIHETFFSHFRCIGNRVEHGNSQVLYAYSIIL